MSRSRVSPAVTWGLFAAWVLHDAEELAMTAWWLSRVRPRLRRRFPWVPTAVWDRLSVNQAHMSAAIAIMGFLFAAASAEGARTGGRSAFYQAVLLGFGLHSVPHVLSAVVVRGYTPGLLTAPTVAAPFSCWAWRALRTEGVSTARIPVWEIVYFPLCLAMAHGGAAALLWLRDRCTVYRAAGTRSASAGSAHPLAGARARWS